jgi:hypothetical protein
VLVVVLVVVVLEVVLVVVLVIVVDVLGVVVVVQLKKKNFLKKTKQLKTLVPTNRSTYEIILSLIQLIVFKRSKKNILITCSTQNILNSTHFFSTTSSTTSSSSLNSELMLSNKNDNQFEFKNSIYLTLKMFKSI